MIHNVGYVILNMGYLRQTMGYLKHVFGYLIHYLGYLIHMVGYVVHNMGYLRQNEGYLIICPMKSQGKRWFCAHIWDISNKLHSKNFIIILYKHPLYRLFQRPSSL